MMEKVMLLKEHINLLQLIADNSVWLIIVLFILIILIVGSIVGYIKLTKYYKLKKKLRGNDDINFDNVVQNAFCSENLYDRLKIKCHPDRFINDKAKMIIATEIFALISDNRYNYQVLKQLKVMAEMELKIKI
mgnify:CR=1 FL=1